MDLTKPVLLPEALESERLLLRPPIEADAQQVNQLTLASFDALHAYMDWAQEPPTLEDSRQFCASGSRELRTGGMCPLLMIRRADGKLIGGTGFANLNLKVPKFEIGYWCTTAEVGKGYVSEAVVAQCRYGFREFDAKRVELRMDVRNVRSERVAQRLGFTLEGTLRNDALRNDGSMRDTRVYALTVLEQLRELDQP